MSWIVTREAVGGGGFLRSLKHRTFSYRYLLRRKAWRHKLFCYVASQCFFLSSFSKPTGRGRQLIKEADERSRFNENKRNNRTRWAKGHWEEISTGVDSVWRKKFRYWSNHDQQIWLENDTAKMPLISRIYFNFDNVRVKKNVSTWGEKFICSLGICEK